LTAGTSIEKYFAACDPSRHGIAGIACGIAGMPRSLRATEADLETSWDAAPEFRKGSERSEGDGDGTKLGAVKRTCCRGWLSTFPHLMWPKPASRCLGLDGTHCKKRFSMLKKETESRSRGAPAAEARTMPPFAEATLTVLRGTVAGTGWVHATAAESRGLLGSRMSVWGICCGCTPARPALDMMPAQRRSTASVWTVQLADVLSIGTYTSLIVTKPGVRCLPSGTLITRHAPGSHA